MCRSVRLVSVVLWNLELPAATGGSGKPMNDFRQHGLVALRVLYDFGLYRYTFLCFARGLEGAAVATSQLLEFGRIQDMFARRIVLELCYTYDAAMNEAVRGHLLH